MEPNPHSPFLDGVVIEKGIVAGNFFNKYATANPVYRRLMNGFLAQVEDFVRMTGCTNIYEAGCGEGYLAYSLANRIPGLSIRGSDFSEAVIEKARLVANASSFDLSFEVRDIYSLSAERPADLVICCEVLEHLEHPEAALQEIANLARKAVILSVPREPIWRVLNFCRGKYMLSLGNTPGHLNHWSPKSFQAMVEKYLTVENVELPLPWIMLLCRPKK